MNFIQKTCGKNHETNEKNDNENVELKEEAVVSEDNAASQEEE